MIDYGPDCSSTPENIQETNELESLRSMREEIVEIMDGVILDANWVSVGFAVEILSKINKVVNPE